MDLKILKGVGPKTIENLNKNDIYSVKDLIEYFPSHYELIELGLKEGRCNVIAEVVSAPKISFFRKNLSSMSFKVKTEEKMINVVIYNRNYLSSNLHPGRKIVIQGNYDKKMTATNIFFNYEPVKPHYRLKDIPQNTFRKYVAEALKHVEKIDETLAEETIKKYKLITRNELLKVVHNPKNINQVKQIYRRTKYEEFLLYQLEMKQLKSLRKIDGLSISINPKTQEFIDGLPFALTNDQNESISKVLNDMESNDSMNRLLQGDVGSGKTIVSIVALYNAYLEGVQSVFMAPTEILAEQHYKKILSLLPNVNVVLLTSSSKTKELLQKVKNENLIVVGTHAVFQKDVEYNNLGLVITDEQHRFGVDQRKNLASKGFKPNVLSMSATPIPRTLAISLFGDIDVSTINEMPLGRKPIKTSMHSFKNLGEVVTVLNEEILEGRQVYIVAPMIQESETVEAANLEQSFEFFSKQLKGNTSMLHGRMKSDQKEDIMRQFVDGTTTTLISTTVIEVGVDVSNASAIVILNADRFGLSQLHQLRGRVGRGNHQSYCYLISDSKNEQTIERLNVLTQTSNGFEISEEDLRLRGPGDFLGSRQSGFPEFTYGDIYKDFKILDVARKDAEEIVYNIEEKKYSIYKNYLEDILGGLYD